MADTTEQGTKPKHAGGRPTDYTQEKADLICSMISDGKSLRTICKVDGMPSMVTVFAWMRNQEEFLNQYTRAKEEQADAFIEDMTEISDSIDGYDNSQIQKARLQVETRKWIASKLKPKKYGDRIQHANDPENPMPAAVTVPPELTDKFGEWLTQSTKQ